MVLLSAFLFSAKAILAKLIYRQVSMPVSQLLVLRMLFSLPFYLGMLAWQWRKFKRQQQHAPAKPWLTRQQLWQVAILGCVGYYVSSYFDFWGLQYVSAGLERIVLFSYPTLVVLLGALLFGHRVQGFQWMALLLTYLGIGLAFYEDINSISGSGAWRGGLLIFTCACTFALYVLYSGRLIPQVGVGLFTAVAMLFATGAVLLHFALFDGRLQQLLGYSPAVYGLLVIMAVFTTVVPSYLVSAGLQRIGSAHVAIISSVGPVLTIAQASWWLHEPFGWWQLAGTVLVVAGVLLTGRKAAKG